MKWIVNALSVTNLSGRHVVSSQLRSLRLHSGADVEILVLHHAGNRDLCKTCGPGLIFRECAGLTQHWIGRVLWERTCLASLIVTEKADVLYMTSGLALPGSPVPQVVLAMNPWCFVPGAWRGAGDWVKAFMQRCAYRQAVVVADVMVYLSSYLRDAYHLEAGREARCHRVLYTPLSEDVWAAVNAPVERVPGRILCVSAMAPHKGVETLVNAVAALVESGLEVSLMLAGGWPDERYRRTIQRQIEALGLTSKVSIAGYLSRSDLLRQYGAAQVFSLLSKCESFGIPGLEAQAFGTPVVCSQAGALPEVYGQGALTVPVGDAAAATGVLLQILDDSALWLSVSDAARLNAMQYRESKLGPAIAEIMLFAGRERGLS